MKNFLENEMGDMDGKNVFDERGIRYMLRRSRRAKRVRVTIACNGEVTLTHPWFVPVSVAERFLFNRAEWVIGKVVEMAGRTPSPLAGLGKRAYLKHREEARLFVLSRIEYWNERFGFRYGKISVRNQKTRWGSCSRKGNLSFNWKLLFLPIEVADYVIIHELCHLARFDHSPEFWALVEEACPEYRTLRSALKTY